MMIVYRLSLISRHSFSRLSISVFGTLKTFAAKSENRPLGPVLSLSGGSGMSFSFATAFHGCRTINTSDRRQ